MHDQIGAMRDRLLPHRRQKGVVHRDQGIERMRATRHRGDIGDAQQRIARRLDPHQFRLARQRGIEHDLVGKIHNGDFVQTARGLGLEQAIAAAVAIVRHDEQIVRPELGGDQGDRRHAGRGDHAADAAFEFGQRTGKHVAGRIAGARVIVGALPGEPGEAEIRGQNQRRHHRAVRGRNRLRRARRSWPADAFDAGSRRRLQRCAQTARQP